MNNSEGQTQEPVGGMLEKIATILYANKSDEGDEGSWINSEDYYKVAEKIEKLFTPPPAPTDGEDEKATAFADSKERRGCSYWQGLYNGFKAGYSASLPQSSTGGLPKLDQPILDEDDVKEIIGPQSSTEEEKELWKTALNFFQGEYILKPFTTKEEVISELLSTYKISKR